ncbi:MAG: glycine cleavage system protein H [Candidatus Riflebacteria bacterium]|nr:glycine cleavage system protein H [Candidatus Riflebacteria bacterium]
MLVLLFLATFVICVCVDVWLTGKEHSGEPAASGAAGVRPEAVFTGAGELHRVEGYRVAQRPNYHPGHTWAVVEDGQTMRVGMDDFAQRLVGNVSRIEVPAVGETVKQGQPCLTLHRGARQARMVSPVNGTVIAVNEAIAPTPGVVHEEPYGKGWLFTVRVADLKSTVNNLIPRGLVNDWMASAARALRVKAQAQAALVYQDGGEPVSDVIAEVGEERWDQLTREFFLE